MLVKITAEDGSLAGGRAFPIPTWSYETPEATLVAIEKYLAPVLIGRDPFDIAGAHVAMNRAIAPSFSTGMPITKAGVDLALHDLTGRLRGQSLAQRWGRKSLARITLSWTVNPQSIGETEKLVEEGRARGYRNFNVKVSPDPKFDLEMCRRVRSSPPTPSFGDARRLRRATALQVAPKLADIGVNVFEQPGRPIASVDASEASGRAADPDGWDWFPALSWVEFIRLGSARRRGHETGTHRRTVGRPAADRNRPGSGIVVSGERADGPGPRPAAALGLYGAYGLKFPAARNGPQF